VVAAEGVGAVGTKVNVLAVELDVPAVLLRAEERFRKVRHGCEPPG
jgi:hypothetical protein